MVTMWNLRSRLFRRIGTSANVDLKHRVTRVDLVTKLSKHSEHIERNGILEEEEYLNQVDYQDTILLLERNREDIGNENVRLGQIQGEEWIPDEFASWDMVRLQGFHMVLLMSVMLSILKNTIMKNNTKNGNENRLD